MELIKILQAIGLEVVNIDELSDEEIEKMVNDELNKKSEHINSLESEKETLSKSNEELTASVEGYKSSEEKLNKELSEMKEKLTATEAKLDQITGLYKENFTKAPEEQEEPKSNKELGDDVLQVILDTK